MHDANTSVEKTPLDIKAAQQNIAWNPLREIDQQDLFELFKFHGAYLSLVVLNELVF